MVEIVIDDTKKKAALVGDLHKNLVALSSAGGVSAAERQTRHRPS